MNIASDWDALTDECIDNYIAADRPRVYKWNTTGNKFRVERLDDTLSELTERGSLNVARIAPEPDEKSPESQSQSYTTIGVIYIGVLPRIVDKGEIGSPTPRTTD